MTSENSKRYDAIPYESHPFFHSHPRWIATVAKVFGMEAPPLEGARILELGCASGGNLIPMAESLPSSHCIGVDLSQRQIADGKIFAEKTGLSNVELRLASILDIDESYGAFDYIVCHGVYSWVDRNVQQKILEICKERLTPKGIAFISYNTYPGWHMKGMMRDMMKFHASRFTDPKQQLSQSRALLNVLAKTVPSEDNPYGLLLKKESELLRQRSDWYIYHEHLEAENDPVYFHEFADRAEKQGLRFLGESELRAMLTDQFSPEIQAALREVATNIVYAEQYMDFFRNRTFRQTLLCRKDIPLKRKLNVHSFQGFSFASALAAQSAESNLSSQEPMTFGHQGKPSATVSTPLAKTTLFCLHEVWPEYSTSEELHQRVRARLNLSPGTADDQEAFTELLWTWFNQGILEMTVSHPYVTSKVAERPRASAVARAQVALQEKNLTNLLHRSVLLGNFDRAVLSLLDGTRNQAELIAKMRELTQDDAQKSPPADAPIVTLDARVNTSLALLAKAGFLCPQ